MIDMKKWINIKNTTNIKRGIKEEDKN